MPRSLWLGLLLSLGFASSLLAQTPGKVVTDPSHAATAGGFPAQLQVDNTKLLLNGSGTRYKVIFQVYDMGLYTARKVSTPREVIELAGPKRLQFKTLRDLKGTDLGVLFIRGMKDNNPPEIVKKHVLVTNRLIEIFSGRETLKQGDTFAMEYLPGKGTTFYIQGIAQGAPVGDAEFFAMVLKIWLGESPADFTLKDALLGLPRASS